MYKGARGPDRGGSGSGLGESAKDLGADGADTGGSGRSICGEDLLIPTLPLLDVRCSSLLDARGGSGRPLLDVRAGSVGPCMRGRLGLSASAFTAGCAGSAGLGCLCFLPRCSAASAGLSGTSTDFARASRVFVSAFVPSRRLPAGVAAAAAALPAGSSGCCVLPGGCCLSAAALLPAAVGASACEGGKSEMYDLATNAAVFVGKSSDPRLPAALFISAANNTMCGVLPPLPPPPLLTRAGCAPGRSGGSPSDAARRAAGCCCDCSPAVRLTLWEACVGLTVALTPAPCARTHTHTHTHS